MTTILYTIPFFEVTLPNGDICEFGNRRDQVEPRIMENRFIYTFTMSNDNIRREVCLTENTIGAALDALYGDEHHIDWWWNVPPSVQWDLEDEGWTAEQIRSTTIGDHLALRIELVAGPDQTLVDTYVAPLLQDDDIVDEFQMEEQPWLPGPPNQFYLEDRLAP